MLTDVQKMRMMLYTVLESDQGHGFVSDDESDCETLEGVAKMAETAAYFMQSAANKARGMAKQCRSKAERDLLRCSTSTTQPALPVASAAACATKTEQK